LNARAIVAGGGRVIKWLGLVGSMLLSAGARWPAHAQNVETTIVKLSQDIAYKGLPGAPQRFSAVLPSPVCTSIASNFYGA
jgi:hypothetical protein